MWWRRHPLSGGELSTYLDGRLREVEARRVEAHFQECRACRRQLEELRATVRALRALPAVPVPRSFALGPEAALPAPVRLARPLTPAYRYAGALSAAALALFLALVGTDLATLGGGREPPAGEPKAVSMPAGAAVEEAAPSRELPAVTPAPSSPAPVEAQATPGAEAFAPPPEAGEEDEGAAAPPPTAAAEAAPAPEEAVPAEEAGGDTGRWVLRGFEAAAAAVFLLGVFVVGGRWWRRRRGHAGNAP